ncbi:unnamed protein product, partial [Brugia timori]|uniref:Secreted protein n=1 Tax=Brugia timori TaxID=42155 RepID=A0A0R3QP93_9BILA
MEIPLCNHVLMILVMFSAFLVEYDLRIRHSCGMILYDHQSDARRINCVRGYPL